MAASARYIIHGTLLDNLSQILATGKLEINPRNATRFLDPDHFNPHQIFAQILFKDLPHQETQLPHWFMCGIILDKSILKAYKWYATRIGEFYERFEDAFKATKQEPNTHNTILAKNANPGASRIISLATLKKHIITQLAAGALGETSFIHSHEVLFGEDISLAKWGVAIMVREWAFCNMISKAEQTAIKTKCQELGLPLVMYGGNQRSRYWTIGLNKMINLIDEDKDKDKDKDKIIDY
jgi:hypothetical protein